jgi:hypothetical protein
VEFGVFSLHLHLHSFPYIAFYMRAPLHVNYRFD